MNCYRENYLYIINHADSHESFIALTRDACVKAPSHARRNKHFVGSQPKPKLDRYLNGNKAVVKVMEKLKNKAKS
jgi:hypothetical protein